MTSILLIILLYVFASLSFSVGFYWTIIESVNYIVNQSFNHWCFLPLVGGGIIIFILFYIHFRQFKN